VPHDRKSETESAVRTRSRCIGLAEFVEYVRKELGFNSDSGIGHSDLCVSGRFEDFDCDASGIRRKLYGVCQQVPHDLLETVGIS
jgi:hypothetical protein